jgi:hypothetical protein
VIGKLLGQAKITNDKTNHYKSKITKTRKAYCTVGGYGSLHEKGVDGGERLAQQRDRNEVTNSRSESKKEQ